MAAKKNHFPIKRLRAVQQHYTQATQPTERGGELGWLGFYHMPVPCALGGIHQGTLIPVAGDRSERPTEEDLC